MRLLAFLFGAFVTLILSGCTTPTPILDEQHHMTLQRELLRPCDPLMTLQEKSYTQAQALEVIKVWSMQYKDCQAKQKALADLLENL